MTEQKPPNGAMKDQTPSAETLLEVANKSSERLAVLHAGFMAACVYVLVIVFGTTDLDLLIGKGIKLPFVNVEVPIVGFYVFAPFILVLVHFNLLLQLELLSRKLHAFDSAAPEGDEIGGLRDRLHIFPFTYYLAGRPGPRVQPFVALMVSITIIMLPLVTLLSLQMVFLAYQEEMFTWMQRIAIWIDIASVAYFWPLIINPSATLSNYWRDLYRAHLPRKRNWLPLGLFVTGLLICLFGINVSVVGLDGLETYEYDINDQIVLALQGLALVFLIPLSGITALFFRKSKPLIRYGSILIALLIIPIFGVLSNLGAFVIPIFWILLFAVTLFWQPDAPRGSLALLLSIFLGFPLTLAMLVDGGSLERGITAMQGSHERQTLFCDLFLNDKRTLYLSERVLLAKQPQPETLALIRSGEWEKGVRQVEPLDLKNRKLRHADLYKCILVRADLRGVDLKGADLSWADLQGANLSGAWLQGANLSGAQLPGADLRDAQLPGAVLSYARLRGADLSWANLSGADLSGAQLQGADLSDAWLQGADLSWANLPGADLSDARFQGADLSNAWLSGADLSEAQLQGADLSWAEIQDAVLSGANIYGASFSDASTNLIDARGIVFTPIQDSVYVEIRNRLQVIEMDKEKKDATLERLERATQPGLPAPTFYFCLVSENSPIKCTNPLHEPEYTEQLHTYLAELACTSPDIARGIIRQIPEHEFGAQSSRFGLKAKLRERLEAGNCEGLAGLTDEEKRALRD